MSFTFKQFHIDDSECAMKVGTDSLLLGAMAKVSPGQRILDIGCGSGLLGLMLAQRVEGDGQIVGVELDEAAAKQAKSNVAASPWPDTMQVVCCDINDYQTTEPFDIIISNPPYFVQSLKGPDAARNQARHSDGLSHQQLLSHIARLLSDSGQCWVILPTEEAEQLALMCQSFGLYLVRQVRVSTKPGKPVHRQILTFEKSGCSGPKVEYLTIHQENTGYSHQYIALTKNFYLNW